MARSKLVLPQRGIDQRRRERRVQRRRQRRRRQRLERSAAGEVSVEVVLSADEGVATTSADEDEDDELQSDGSLEQDTRLICSMASIEVSPRTPAHPAHPRALRAAWEPRVAVKSVPACLLALAG